MSAYIHIDFIHFQYSAARHGASFASPPAAAAAATTTAASAQERVDREGQLTGTVQQL